MSGWVYGPGGSTSPGGSDGDIQFNNNGSFSGSNLLTTDGSGSLSASTHVSASTFYGDGSNLTGVTASAVQVADGPEFSLQFRYDTPVSGDLSGSANLTWNTSSLDLLVTGNVRVQEDYEFYGDIEGAVRFPARAAEVGGITKGQVVYIKGISGQTPTVALAACDDPSKMPAFGLAGQTAASGSDIQIVTFGSLKSLNLTALYDQTFAVGDTVYVQTGSGGNAGKLTNVRPTGSGNLLQNMGKVVRNGGGGDGQIKVGGAGRTNATPNLDKGHLFVGDDTNCSVQDSTVFISSSAERVGINITVPTAALHVSASSVLGGESGRFEGEVVITSPEGKLAVQDTTNNYQVTLVPASFPRISFGTIGTPTQFMVIDGGSTNRIITVGDFFIGTSSTYNQGLYYDVSEERLGIHTSTPTHDFTVNGDLSVSSSANGSINIGEGIKYTFDGVDRLDAFENEFKLREVMHYKAVSSEQTANFTFRGNQTFLVNCTGSAITGSLPDLSSTDDIGLTFTVKDLYGSGSTNNIHITSSASPGQLIDGGNALKIQTDYGAVTLTALSSSRDGYGWGIVSVT